MTSFKPSSTTSSTSSTREKPRAPTSSPPASGYVEALEKGLRPVAKHVEDRITRYVRGITQVDLMPAMPEVGNAIAGAQVLKKLASEAAGTGT